MKGVGVFMVALGGMVIYWAWNGSDLSALPNTPLPEAHSAPGGPSGQPLGPVTPPPAPGSPLGNILFPGGPSA